MTCPRACPTRRTLVSALLARAEENDALRGAQGCDRRMDGHPDGIRCVLPPGHRFGCVFVSGTAEAAG